MPHESWMLGPIGVAAQQRVTRADCRMVLVMVPTITEGTRLLELVSLLEGDHRVQVMFTVPRRTDTRHGVHEFAEGGGRLVIPWHQALHHRFDLVLAAGFDGLDLVHGPVMFIPHGASNLMSRKYSSRGGPDALPHHGLARETLLRRGRLIPSVLGLTHDAELAALRRSCPEAVPRAVVAGDICFDRMLTSRGRRAAYRRALGVGGAQRLVTVSSTWTTESLFGRHPDLCRRLAADLPDTRYRVAAVLHPNVWHVHGRAQILAWLAPAVRAGLRIIPPEEGWQATMIASDVVIGDYGSTTQYAAAIGRPVLLAAYPEGGIRAGSIASVLAATAPRFDPGRPAEPQLRRPGAAPDIAGLVTARPGRAAGILRRAMYGALRLSEPERPAAVASFPPPCPLRVGHRSRGRSR